MPLEYVLTGWWMKSPISAKRSISARRASVSRRAKPISEAFMKTFSKPVNSGLKPAPSSSSAATRPATQTLPCVGSSVPVTICKSVDLPLPFGPTIPVVVPRAISKLTPRSAQNSRCNFQRPRVSDSLRRSLGCS